MIIAALLLGGVVNAQNYWGDDPDSHAQPSNTPIVASVQIDGEAVAATSTMRLGAFVGEDLRGIAAPHTDGNFWIQVFYTDDTDNITFKFYDGTTETEYATCETSLAGQDEGHGTPSTPEVLNFTTTQTMTQTSNLASGWTWWSTPVEMEDNNGLQQLENSISEYGIQIKSQNAVLNRRGNGWVGSITSLQNEMSYRVNVSAPSQISITGVMADPSNHEITINNGWNWIGYPVSVPQTVNSALSGSGLSPQNGDVIKGQDGFAQYRNGNWIPTSFTLNPGMGYMYDSKASNPKTFVFVNNNSRSYVVQSITEDSFWTADIHKYENNLALLAVVFIGNEEQRDEALELGAFVNGECTGRTKLYYVEEDDRYYAMLTVGGSEGNSISFGLVNEAKGLLYNESTNNLVFTNNAIVGDFDNPYEIHFNTLGIGENSEHIALYPNPLDRGQSFKLNIPLEEEVSDVTIINAMGAIVRHETGALKNTLAGFSVSGVYTVKVSCRSGNTYFGKLIVK